MNSTALGVESNLIEQVIPPTEQRKEKSKGQDISL